MKERLRIAIPSTGALYEGTGQLLEESDSAVSRINSRRYTAVIPSIPGVDVIYQRQSDITKIIDSGNADLGIVGLDRYLESRLEDGDTLVVAPDLKFGRSKLVIAVPEAWVDVTTVYDLADIAVGFHEQGRDLRIATKYPRLLRRYLHRRGVMFFSIVDINGALEAMPWIGYADVIADITDTGNTLRENSLRPLLDGVIIESQSIMIGNARLLAASDSKLNLTRSLLERIEARLRSDDYNRVTANVKGGSEEKIAEMVLSSPELSGMAGPTVSQVFTEDRESWFSVQVVARKSDVMRVVDHLRSIGGTGTAVTDLEFLYREECELHAQLLEKLDTYRRDE